MCDGMTRRLPLAGRPSFKAFLLLPTLLIPSAASFAQDALAHQTGLIATPRYQYERIPLFDPAILVIQEDRQGRLVTAPVPPERLPTSIDLSPWARPAELSQTGNSCVGWAIAGSYTIQIALSRGTKHPGAHESFSAAFIYNQINGGKDEGSYIYNTARPDRSGFHLVVEKGCASLATVPPSAGLFDQPSEVAFEEAANFRAFATDDRRCRTPEGMKRALAEYVPIVIGVHANADFVRLHDSGLYRWNGLPEKGDRHAMCVVGYDDRNQAFHVMNSWGDTWGNAGFVWVPYDEFATIDDQHWCYEAHCFRVVNNAAPQARRTQGPDKRTFALYTNGEICRRFSETANGQIGSAFTSIAPASFSRMIAATGNRLYALTAVGSLVAYTGEGMIWAVDEGKSWRQAPTPAGEPVPMSMIAATSDNVFALDARHRIWKRGDNLDSQWEAEEIISREHNDGVDIPYCIDLRERTGSVTATFSDGHVYRWDDGRWLRQSRR